MLNLTTLKGNLFCENIGRMKNEFIMYEPFSFSPFRNEILLLLSLLLSFLLL